MGPLLPDLPNAGTMQPGWHLQRSGRSGVRWVLGCSYQKAAGSNSWPGHLAPPGLDLTMPESPLKLRNKVKP